jgi:hypothetical protein
MKPVSMKIKNWSRGNADPNLMRAKAGLGWHPQLLICFGDINLDKSDEPAADDELAKAAGGTISAPLPDCFKKNKLRVFDFKRTLRGLTSTTMEL